MSNEQETRETFSKGFYQRATVVPSKKQPSDSMSLWGRVVSTRKTKGDLDIRVTTRQVSVRGATK